MYKNNLQLVNCLLCCVCLLALTATAASQSMRVLEQIRCAGSSPWTPPECVLSDPDGSVTVVFWTCDWDTLRFEHNNVAPFTPQYTSKTTWICHFDPTGSLAWKIPITRVEYAHFQTTHFLHREQSGAYSLYFVCYMKYLLGADTLMCSDRDIYSEALVRIRIAANGEVLNQEFLSTGKEFELDAMTEDDQHNVYLAGRYSDYQCTLFGQTLSSNESPSYFIAKLSDSGELQWLRGTRTGWTTLSRICAIALQPISRQLYVLYSEATPSTWSSCRFHHWSLQLQRWSAEGELLHKDSLAECSDVLVGTNMKIDQWGNCFVLAAFRDSLWSGGFRVLSPSSAATCPVFNSALIHLSSDAQVQRVMHLSHDRLQYYQELHLSADAHLFVGGYAMYDDKVVDWKGKPYPGGTRRTEFAEYDYLGNLLQLRQFNKDAQQFESSQLYGNLCTSLRKGNELVVAEGFRNVYDTLSLPQSEKYMSGVVLYTLSMLDTIRAERSARAVFSLGVEGQASGQLLVQHSEAGDTAFSYQIFDALGRLIRTNSDVLESPVETIPIQSLHQGAYFIRLQSKSTTAVLPFVVVR